MNKEIKEARDTILELDVIKNNKKAKEEINNIFKEKLGISISKTLNKYSWSEIAKISESGNAEKYFKIGDTKKFYLYTGEPCEAVIIGFNHDKINGTNKTAGITFMIKDLLDGEFEMNETETNIDSWEKCKMRNVYMPRFYRLLPKELREIIKPVLKETDNNITIDSLFLPSYDEVFNYKYPYFKDKNNRIKNKNNKPSLWWLRSPSYISTYSYYTVNSDGSYFATTAHYNNGVSFCFAI